MPTITRAELRDKLFSLRGATIVTIVAETSPVLIGGKKCPLAGLRKVAVLNGMVNWSYENAVNTQRQREETPLDEAGSVEYFVPHPRSWGRRLHDSLPTRSGKPRLLPLVDKMVPADGSSTITAEELSTRPVDELYLEMKAQNSLGYRYFLGEEEIEADVAHQHIRQPGPTRQGVENEIVLRDYKLTSLRSITMQGETFDLVD